MSYADELKFFWSLVWKPEKESKRQLDLGSALRLYYSLAVLPFVAYLVVGGIAAMFGARAGISPGSPLNSVLDVAAKISFVSVFWGGILLFFILIPIGIAIDALIYQIIAKIFLNAWKGNYERTFTALVYGVLPVLMLLWLSFVPIINAIYIIIAPVWALVVFIIALSVQQKIRRLDALLIVIVKSILVIAVLALLGISIVATVAYLAGSVIQAGSSFVPWGNLTAAGWHMGNLGTGPYGWFNTTK